MRVQRAQINTNLNHCITMIIITMMIIIMIIIMIISMAINFYTMNQNNQNSKNWSEF